MNRRSEEEEEVVGWLFGGLSCLVSEFGSRLSTSAAARERSRERRPRKGPIKEFIPSMEAKRVGPQFLLPFDPRPSDQPWGLSSLALRPLPPTTTTSFHYSYPSARFPVSSCSTLEEKAETKHFTRLFFFSPTPEPFGFPRHEQATRSLASELRNAQIRSPRPDEERELWRRATDAEA